MTHPFSVKRIHHVDYRCKDAMQTANWFARVLGMAVAENQVPSTGAYGP